MKGVERLKGLREIHWSQDRWKIRVPVKACPELKTTSAADPGGSRVDNAAGTDRTPPVQTNHNVLMVGGNIQKTSAR